MEAAEDAVAARRAAELTGGVPQHSWRIHYLLAVRPRPLAIVETAPSAYAMFGNVGMLSSAAALMLHHLPMREPAAAMAPRSLVACLFVCVCPMLCELGAQLPFKRWPRRGQGTFSAAHHEPHHAVLHTPSNLNVKDV